MDISVRIHKELEIDISIQGWGGLIRHDYRVVYNTEDKVYSIYRLDDPSINWISNDLLDCLVEIDGSDKFITYHGGLTKSEHGHWKKAGLSIERMLFIFEEHKEESKNIERNLSKEIHEYNKKAFTGLVYDNSQGERQWKSK